MMTNKLVMLMQKNMQAKLELYLNQLVLSKAKIQQYEIYIIQDLFSTVAELALGAP